MKKKQAVLIAALLALCALCPTAFAARMERYANAQQYTAGDFEYNAADVQRVEIHWIAGSVTLMQSDVDTLRAYESGSSKSDDMQMQHLLADGVLYIQFCQAGAQYSSLFFTPKKALTLAVPAGIALSVETRSADIALHEHQLGNTVLQSTSGDIHADYLLSERLSVSSTSGSLDITAADAHQTMSLCSTSGGIQAGGLRADTILLDTTSGSIHADAMAAAARIRAESTSGAIALKQLQSPQLEIETTSGSIAAGLCGSQKAAIRSVSGSVKLTLHGSLGAAVDFHTASGSFHCDDSHTANGRALIGNGACELSVRTASGSLTIAQQP